MVRVGGGEGCSYTAGTKQRSDNRKEPGNIKSTRAHHLGLEIWLKW
jgi:hypothetical protein